VSAGPYVVRGGDGPLELVSEAASKDTTKMVVRGLTDWVHGCGFRSAHYGDHYRSLQPLLSAPS